MPVHTNNYTLGRGKLYFDAFDAQGNETGFRYLGNAPEFNVNVTTETLEHISSESGIGEKDDEVVLSVTRAGTVILEDVSVENQALFVVGGVADVVDAGGAVVDESIQNVNTGRWYQLGATALVPTGARNISAVTVTDDPEVATYVEDTDYELDLALGRLYIIPGGGISDGDDLLVDYTTAAGTRKQVATGESPSTQGKLHYIADNPKGDNRDLLARNVELAPDGDYPLIGEEWTQMPFSVLFNAPASGEAQILIDGRPV